MRCPFILSPCTSFVLHHYNDPLGTRLEHGSLNNHGGSAFKIGLTNLLTPWIVFSGVIRSISRIPPHFGGKCVQDPNTAKFTVAAPNSKKV